MHWGESHLAHHVKASRVVRIPLYLRVLACPAGSHGFQAAAASLPLLLPPLLPLLLPLPLPPLLLVLLPLPLPLVPAAACC